MDQVAFYIGLLGTIAFSVTGVLSIADRGVDLFGVVVLGLVTAIGGGTSRDIILQVPIFWAESQLYVWLSIAACVTAFFAFPFFSMPQIHKLMLYLDALGAALFGISGAEKAWNLEWGQPLGPIVLGVLTAIGGGLLRDIMAGRKTLLMTHEIYAIPVTLGCTLYILILNYAPQHSLGGSVSCMLLIFLMRSAAIFFDLRVPSIFITKAREQLD